MLVAREIAICPASVYALGASVCSAIQEAIAQWLQLRWKNLEPALDDRLERQDTDAGGDLLGWNAHTVSAAKGSGVLMMIFGWLASGFAMSLGARFWFDALSRLSIRAGLSEADSKAAADRAATAPAAKKQNP